MLKRLFVLTLIAASGIAATSATALAWERIGSRKVGFLADRDVISAAGEGRFSQIRLCVARNEIEMRDLDVTFGNGHKQDVKVRNHFSAGSCTRAIDLKGGKRRIRQVAMIYRSRPSFKGQAVITLFAR